MTTQDHTAALRWTAAALQSLADNGMSEHSTFTVDGVTKSVRQILDEADQALESPPAPAEQMPPRSFRDWWLSLPDDLKLGYASNGVLAAERAFEVASKQTAPAEPQGVPVLAAAMALLVAGGFVAQAKVDEAIQIALHTPGATEISANDAPPPQQPAQGQDAKDVAPEEWMLEDGDRRWMVIEALKRNSKQMHVSEAQARGAYKKDYMGLPYRYIAAAYAEAGAVFDKHLAALQAAMSAAQGD